MSIPKALQPLSDICPRQFITWREGKVPTDYRSGLDHDPHDPDIWTDYDTAFARGQGKVGFVLTDRDPFFCLDIDKCYNAETGWSGLATKLLQLLPNAAVEVSQSGTGLHVFGTGKIPRHANKNAALGIELYHDKRFIALGFTDPPPTGLASTDCTSALEVIVQNYFPVKRDEAASALWTDGPIATWRGPTDDDDLVRRMCDSKTAGAIFGGKCAASDLWDAKPGALKRNFPSPDRDYDASSADAAMVEHLAFWTGNDCERIKRILARCALRRDKWEREDYLRTTILNVVAMRRTDVCRDKAPVVVAQGMPVGTFLTPDMQKLFFDRCCYVADMNKVIMPGGHTYKKEQLETMLGGYLFSLDTQNIKFTKSAWEALTQSHAVQFDKAHSSSFRPDLPPGAVWVDGNEKIVNSYWPILTESTQGVAAPFLKHLAKILPNEVDRKIVLDYMAGLVQYRGRKFQWCPLIQGVEGNGKTALSRCVAAAIGQKHCHFPKASEIVEKFNDWMEGKIFIGVEDIYVPKEKLETIEILKPMITGDMQEIRSMGMNKVTKRICANYILNSNHKDAIKKTRNDRRFAVFFCAQQCESDLHRDKMDGDYFPKLYAWFRGGGYAIVTDYLQHYPVPDISWFEGRAPITSSTEEAVSESLGTIEQEVMGAVLEDRVGFRDGWISSHYLKLLIKDCGSNRHIAANKMRDMLTELGYIGHPGLACAQSTSIVQPDGIKPRLYVKPGHPSIDLRGAAVGRAYSAAQLSTEGNLRLA